MTRTRITNERLGVLRPPNSWGLFLKHYKGRAKPWPLTTRLSSKVSVFRLDLLSQKWKLCTPEEKAAFKESAEALKDKSVTQRERALQVKAGGFLLATPGSPTAQTAVEGSDASCPDLFGLSVRWMPMQTSTGIPVVRTLSWNREDSLGKGRYACVVKAADKSTGEAFALKLSTRQFAESLQVEFDFLVTSNHPNLIRVYGFVVERHGCVQDFSGMVTELAKESLEQWIMRRRCKVVLSPEDKIAAGFAWTQLLHGAGYMHTRNVVHCDIKPANVLAKYSGTFCLADFGLLRPAGEKVACGKQLYTPGYRPLECELAAGMPVIAALSMDVWAMACLLYDIATEHDKLSTCLLFDRIVIGQDIYASIRRVRGLALGRCTRYCAGNAGVAQVIKACITQSEERSTISELLGIHVDLNI